MHKEATRKDRKTAPGFRIAYSKMAMKGQKLLLKTIFWSETCCSG